jgi:hypothetical protein
MPRYAPFSGEIPSPGVAYDAAPYHCLKISEAWVPIVIGALNALTYECDYVTDEAGQIFAANEAKMLILAVIHGNIACVEDVMYLLRQSPFDPCVLEQSVDNGLSWTTAFDYRRCFANQRTFTEPELQSIIVNTQVDVQTLVSIYQDDPLNVFTDGTFDQGPDDEYRDGAMCYALNLLIIDLSQMAADRMDNGTDWRDVARFVAVAVKTVGEIILAFGGGALLSAKPEWFFATAIAIGVADWAIGFIDANDREPDLVPLLSSDVQQALICCAMDVLQGSTPSIGLFSSIFTGCSVPDMNADTLELLEYLTENEGVYLSFLQMCQTSFEALAGGQVFNCGCGDEMIAADFTAESGSEPGVSYGIAGWQLGAANPGCGVYLSGTGVIAGNETTSDFTKHRGSSVASAVSGTISRVRINYDIQLSNEIDGGDCGFINYGGDGRIFGIVEVGNGNDRWIERVASRVVTSDLLICQVYCYIHGTTNPQWAGNVTLKRIEVYGSGLSWG